MEWAALITWVLTAGGGFVLLATWLSRGGMRQQQEAGRRIRPPLILSHFALAILGVVAVLGFTMFAIWTRQRNDPTQRAALESAGAPAEQHFPVPVVALHGLLAVTTVVLVLLTALGVGES